MFRMRSRSHSIPKQIRLVVVDGAKNFDLAHVKISTISINGYNGEISIGIERSSWAIVLQTYSQNPPIAEFGQCQLAAPTH